MTTKTETIKQVDHTDFLPQGYTVPDKARQFMKLQNGDNIIQVLSTPMLGWVIFTEDKKPVRKEFTEGNNNFTKQELIDHKAKKNEEGQFEPPKHFWLLLIWDYETNSPKILEITQISIIKKLTAYIKDEDWGDLRDYKINITRSGTSKNDTEYDVIAKPKKDLPENVANFLKEAQEKNIVNLSAIWDGQYPFEIYNY